MAKKFKFQKNHFELSTDKVEIWQEGLAMSNFQLIRQYSAEKKAQRVAHAALRERKSELLLELKERKASGDKKISTEKVIEAMINLDPEVIRLREERDIAEIQADQYNRILLLYRDMWGAAETMRQHNTAEMRNQI